MYRKHRKHKAHQTQQTLRAHRIRSQTWVARQGRAREAYGWGALYLPTEIPNNTKYRTLVGDN
jgi:hypothetical protein